MKKKLPYDIFYGVIISDTVKSRRDDGKTSTRCLSLNDTCVSNGIYYYGYFFFSNLDRDFSHFTNTKITD